MGTIRKKQYLNRILFSCEQNKVLKTKLINLIISVQSVYLDSTRTDLFPVSGCTGQPTSSYWTGRYASSDSWYVSNVCGKSIKNPNPQIPTGGIQNKPISPFMIPVKNKTGYFSI